MLWPVILLSAATFEIDPAWKPVADPLAPVRAGQIQCHQPDLAARTCEIMTWYDVRPDGSARTRSVAAVDDRKAWAVETRMDMRHDRAGLCGVVDNKFIQSVRSVQVRPPHAATNNKELESVFRQLLMGMFGEGMVCSRYYARDEDELHLDVGTINGEFADGLMMYFVWISPAAGYRLKAPDGS